MTIPATIKQFRKARACKAIEFYDDFVARPIIEFRSNCLSGWCRRRKSEPDLIRISTSELGKYAREGYKVMKIAGSCCWVSKS